MEALGPARENRVISPLLANAYPHRFDTFLHAKGGPAHRPKAKLVR
jgi:hypothetical protein